MVRERVMTALASAVRQVPDGSLVCVYTHQNVIKSVVYPWLSWDIDTTMSAKLDVVSVTELVYANGRVRLEHFNRSV